MNLKGIKVKTHDMSLRDGMHPKRHQISIEQMQKIATGLDVAGVPLIEVTHGDGLGGGSVNYGFAAASDEDYLRAVVPLMKQASGFKNFTGRMRAPGVSRAMRALAASCSSVPTSRSMSRAAGPWAP